MSILSLVLIAVDRFIATVYPLKASNITGKIRAILLILCWILPALGLIHFFVYSEIIKVDENTSCDAPLGVENLPFSELYTILLFTVVFNSCLVLSHHEAFTKKRAT